MDWLKNILDTFEKDVRLKNEKLATENKVKEDKLSANRKELTACYKDNITPVFAKIKRELTSRQYYCTYHVDELMETPTGEQYVVNCDFKLSHTKKIGAGLGGVRNDSISSLSFRGDFNDLKIHIEGHVANPIADSRPIIHNISLSDLTLASVDDIAKDFVKQVFAVRNI